MSTLNYAPLEYASHPNLLTAPLPTEATFSAAGTLNFAPAKPSGATKSPLAVRRRLLIILGEADDLAPWLQRDIVLSLIMPYAASGSLDKVDHDLVSATAKKLAAELGEDPGLAAVLAADGVSPTPGLPACGTHVEVEDFEVTLLNNPTSRELKKFLYHYGRGAMRADLEDGEDSDLPGPTVGQHGEAFVQGSYISTATVEASAVKESDKTAAESSEPVKPAAAPAGDECSSTKSDDPSDALPPTADAPTTAGEKGKATSTAVGEGEPDLRAAASDAAPVEGSAESKGEADDNTFKQGNPAAWPWFQSIIYNGHGGEDGSISLQDVDMSGGKLYSMISKYLGPYMGELHLYLNCCYGAEIVRSCAAKVSEAKLDTVDEILACALGISAAQFTEGRDTYTEFQEHFDYEDEAGVSSPVLQQVAMAGAGAPSDRTVTLPTDASVERTATPQTTVPFTEDDMEMLKRMQAIDGRVGLPMAGDDGRRFCVHPLGVGPIPPEGALKHAMDAAHLVKPLHDLTKVWQDSAVVCSAPARLTLLTRLTTKAALLAREGWFTKDTPVIGLFHAGCADTTIMSLPNDSDGGHTTVMVDGGLKKHAQALWTEALGGFGTLDHLFVSHSDKDHIGGIVTLVDSCKHARIDLELKHLYISSPLQHRGHANLIAKVVKGFGAEQHLDLITGAKLNICDSCVAYVLSPDATLRAALMKKLASGRATIYNRAALALLFVWTKGTQHKTLLFTSDCPGKYVAAGLKAAVAKWPRELGDSVLPRAIEDGAFIVDYMDIPHHGSKRDSPPDLFRTVRACTYGWSSDGGKSHPSSMGDATVMKRMIDAHSNKQPPNPRAVFTFPEGTWARTRAAGSENSKVITEWYADRDRNMTWVTP